jgi:hypothetical protein
MLASLFEWYGLHWTNSWPLVLVAYGAGMVTTAILRPLFAPAATVPHREVEHDA